MADALHTPGVVDAKDGRLDDAGLIACQTSTLDVRTGALVAPGVTALVSGTSDTGTMTYQIAAHHWVSSRGVANGPYRGALEAATTVATTAAPGSNSRIDVIWVKQQDNTAGIPTPDAAVGELYGVTQGTAAVSPTKPTIPVGALELATAVVAAGATSTNGAGVTITNTVKITAARGAPVPVRSSAERDALTAYDGLSVKRLDLGGVEQQRISGAWKTVTTDPVPAYKVGAASPTSNPSGEVTITHGLGATPSAVFIQSRTAGAVDATVHAVTAVTATTFTYKTYYNGSLNASATHSIYWRVDA